MTGDGAKVPGECEHVPEPGIFLEEGVSSAESGLCDELFKSVEPVAHDLIGKELDWVLSVSPVVGKRAGPLYVARGNACWYSLFRHLTGVEGIV